MPEQYKTIAITLYQECMITKQRNCKVDSIDTYLAGLQAKSYSAVQSPLSYYDMSFSIVLTNNDYNAINKTYNYAKLDMGIYYIYCFVIDAKLCGNGQVRYFFEVDTINSFWADMLFSDKCHITRQHQDRFQEVVMTEGANTLYRIIDKHPEEFNPPLFKSTSSYINQANFNMDWYLIYKTEKVLDPSDLSNPLHCYLCASSDFELERGGVSTETYTEDDFEGDHTYFINYSLGVNDADINIFYNNNLVQSLTLGTGSASKYDRVIIKCTISGGVKYLSINAKNSSTQIWFTPDIVFDELEIDGVIYACYVSANIYDSAQEKSDYTYNLVKQANILWDSGLGSNPQIKNITSIDKTDSTIMKIIGLPYCPTSATYDNNNNNYLFDLSKWRYNPEMQMLELTDLELNFKNTIATKDLSLNVSITKNSSTLTASRSKTYESKLYNSSFYQLKYSYDTFTKIIPFEDCLNVLLNNPTFNINFIMSNQLNSRFMFEFEVVDGYSWASEGDYPEFLMVSRNNEIALYNNDYLNYMRTGYNFDVKNKNLQKATSLIGAGVAVAGAVAGAVSGGIGFAVVGSLISTATTLVSSSIRADEALEQKQRQLQAQSGSVSANDDFNLLKKYSKNRLMESIYKVSTATENALYNYFFLFGYACNTYEKPKQNTRAWFNFIQFTPAFEENTGGPDEVFISQEMLDNFIERCKQGITIYHCNNYEWDFNQQYENWEAWIVE